jgi:chlorite dismutase
MTREGRPKEADLKKDQTAPRQYVRFSFYKLSSAWRELSGSQQADAKRELAGAIRSIPAGTLARSYSLVGTRGDVDMMIWQVSRKLEDLQTLATEIRKTVLGSYLDMPVSYFSMTRRSIYEIPGEAEEQLDARLTVAPGAHKYLFIYPFLKTRSWYDLEQEKRQEMMNHHISVGRKYPSIRLHTTYSYGLDDQEFVLAFETDSPSDFLDLVMDLRHTKASMYTLRDTPIFTCVAGSIDEVLDSLGGKPAESGSASEGDDEVEIDLDSLPPGGVTRVFVADQSVMVANIDGRIHAVSGVCTHARGPLAEGELDGCLITCPWHQAVFDVTTGEAVDGPAKSKLTQYNVRQYDSKAVISAPEGAADRPVEMNAMDLVNESPASTGG